MLAGRGFATAIVLALIVLACSTVARRVERERRLVATLRARGAIDAAHALPLEALSSAERDATHNLRTAGVVEILRGRCHLVPASIARFRRKRTRLVLTSAAVAALLAAGLVALILAR